MSGEVLKWEVSKAWELTTIFNRRIARKSIHVWPLGDTHEHRTTKCWCKPEIDDEGVVIHNAADGREAYETGLRTPN